MKKNINFTFISCLILLLNSCASHSHSQPYKNNDEYPFYLNEQASVLLNKNDIEWSSFADQTRELAKNNFKNRMAILSDIFASSIDPYKGVISLPEKCLPEKLPKTITVDTAKYYSMAISLYSSMGKVFGMCSDPEKVLKTQYQLLYCEKQKMIFIIKGFYSDKKPWLESQMAHCKE